MAAETVEGAAEASAGMPQLDFSTFPNQIFWLVVTLVVIYLVVSRIIIPRIGGVIADRQSSIERDLAQAQELRRRAEEVEAEYEKAIAEAKAEAHRITERAKAEIQEEIKAAMEAADARIAEMSAQSEKRIAEIRATALENVGEVAREVAEEIVRGIMPSAADAKLIESAISARLKG
ncbi:MAG: F0F1 ATP synthase subunit B' [Alphaproteobacteria bacterium]|nr:MAG: F0F1 ATP synthase subunit B' [Alphaproteobacteria bacterium]